MRRSNLFSSDDAKVTWICDSKTGCGATASTNGTSPEGWLTTTIQRDGLLMPFNTSFDLCPECAEKTARFIKKACEMVGGHRHRLKSSPMTYEEIVSALRLGERLGDCVPEDIEGTARAIVAERTPRHVVVYDDTGAAIDPTVPPRRP